MPLETPLLSRADGPDTKRAFPTLQNLHEKEPLCDDFHCTNTLETSSQLPRSYQICPKLYKTAVM